MTAGEPSKRTLLDRLKQLADARRDVIQEDDAWEWAGGPAGLPFTRDELNRIVRAMPADMVALRAVQTVDQERIRCWGPLFLAELHGMPHPEPSTPPVDDEALLCRLVNARNHIAIRLRGTPRSMLTDDELRILAQHRPLTMPDLLALPGVHKLNADAWGAEFLEVIVRCFSTAEAEQDDGPGGLNGDTPFENGTGDDIRQEARKRNAEVLPASSEERVVDYLKAIPARRELANRLGADPNGLHCYYICSLSNLESIIQGGIDCHDAAASTVDLSSVEVQHRRRAIGLGRSTANPPVRRSVQTHACVNFFWNPLNRTFEAFQRNALLRRRSRAALTDEVVCMLEVDAESLLRDGRTFWGVAASNIAVGSPSCFEVADMQDSQKFPWDAIFAPTPPTDRQAATHQAAEFVIFTGTGPNSEPVPWSLVRRILLPVNEAACLEAERIKATDETAVTPVNVYRIRRELLDAERWFIAFLAGFQRETDAAVAEKIETTFRSLIEFEERIGTPHRDPYSFDSDSLAYGLHGIAHVVRVMFWTRFLLCYEDASASNASDCCLMAALLHDLCRTSDYEEQSHGRVAAARFANGVWATHGASDQASVASVLNAVAMHCRDDCDCPTEEQDLVWTILRDADALERGRFNIPNRPGGCEWTQLRTPMLKTRDQKARIGSVAYHMAGMTRYTSWSQSPCADLLSTLCAGLQAAEREEVFELFESQERSLLSELLERLSPLDEKQHARRAGV